MSFLSFSHVLINEEFVKHVLYGEQGDLGRGGHLFGTRREGKTEFPVGWDPAIAIQAMNSLREKPEFIHYVGKAIFLRKHIRGVLVEMKLVQSKGSLFPVSCFPVSGKGVVLNVGGSQVSLEISLSKEDE